MHDTNCVIRTNTQEVPNKSLMVLFITYLVNKRNNTLRLRLLVIVKVRSLSFLLIL